MAKVRNSANTLRKGRIGENTWYVRNGEQIVRQSRNNSNYGDEARRTELQQARRARWGNLVNFYKACKFWMPKAYETKASNQSDYNKFMQLNVNSTPVYLTKEQVEVGGSVVAPYIISQGSLTPVVVSAAAGSDLAQFLLPIRYHFEGDTTVAQLSQVLLSEGSGWAVGDNFAFVWFSNAVDENGIPRVYTEYTEFTINPNDNTPLTDLGIIVMNDQAISNALIGATSDAYNNAIASTIIHTRVVDGSLKVSTQSVVMLKDTVLSQFTSDAARLAAIASLGVDSDVPLYPGD